jgi:hypothetical protein
VSDRSLLFAGLPSTGKTTYLALVNVAIQTNADGSVKLLSHKGNFEYVDQISGDLEACIVAEHTHVEEQGELDLELAINGTHGHLRIPDISGETWEDALDERSWTVAFDDAVATCAGLVLFINADQVELGGTILDAEALTAALAEGAEMPGDGPPSETSIDPATQPAERAKAPDDKSPGDEERGASPEHQRSRVRATQVDAVDLLQIVSRRNPRRPLWVSIVLSAWDTITGTTPAAWLDTTFPLLRQYLKNTKVWEWRIFGVSAQGGDFTKQKVKDALLDKAAVERASVVAADGATESVHAPILWVLESG